jgi:glutathione peroxidase
MVSFKWKNSTNSLTFCEVSMSTIYDFSVEDAHGGQQPLSQYRGKVVLVVNTASKCGYTPQYKDLQALYEAWHEKGLDILAFPCNQFGQQEPGSNAEIQQFCQGNYGLTFPVFGKIDVNGKDAHPLYKYLCSQNENSSSSDIQWNFTKFLIDQDGEVVHRYEPSISPKEIGKEIQTLIKPE